MSLTLVSYSQTNQCDLNLRFFDIYESGFLNDVNVKLIEVESKKAQKGTKLAETLVFSGLRSGTYQVELNKKGYQKEIKKFLVDCSFADESNRVFENIFLRKGNSKEVVKLDSTDIKDVFGILNHSSNQTEFVMAGDKDAKSINQTAQHLVKPIYPAAARAVRASGQVNVQVTIDEDGNVIKAKAVDGHALLQSAAIKAVRQSKFSPTLLSGIPVKISGVIVYNFTPQ